MNFSSSSGPAEEVASAIQRSGGDAITLKADISKPEEVQRCFPVLNVPPCTNYARAPSVRPESSRPGVHRGDHNVCCVCENLGGLHTHASACELMSAADDLVIRQSGLSEL